MDWTNEFLSRCLSGIPDGRYRRRVRGELADHLEFLVRDLTGAGLSEEEARREALRNMGDPEALNREYLAAWSRRARPFRDFGLCLAGGAVALVSLGLIGQLLGIVILLFAQCGPERLTSMILNGPFSDACYGWVLYAITYLPAAAFLGRAFRGRHSARTLTTSGLVMTWAVEAAAILLLSAQVYGIPLSDPLPLLQRISQGGDVAGPWFNVPYLVSSFAACLALGQLFGRKRPEQKAA